MPSLPAYNQCAFFGCKAPKIKGAQYCGDHGGKPPAMDKDRRVFNAMYKSPFWLSTRANQLSMFPLCAGCMARGIVTPAAHVDHVFPWAKIGSAAFRHNLFQSLCGSCHSHKTAGENQGICTHYLASGIKEYKITDYAYIMGLNRQ